MHSQHAVQVAENHIGEEAVAYEAELVQLHLSWVQVAGCLVRKIAFDLHNNKHSK